MGFLILGHSVTVPAAFAPTTPTGLISWLFLIVFSWVEFDYGVNFLFLDFSVGNVIASMRD